MIQIAAGVFGADQPSCARMFALAVRAWTELKGLPIRQISMCCSPSEMPVIAVSISEAMAMSKQEVEAAVAQILISEEQEPRMDKIPATHTKYQRDRGEPPPDDSKGVFRYPTLAAFKLPMLLTREFLHFDI